MVKTALTKRQRQILDFVLSEIHRKGYPPSVREIGEAVGLSSTSTVHNHLVALEQKGYIRRDPAKPRALEVFDYRDTEGAVSSERVRSIPIVGRIAAGQPILAQENIEDILTLPAELTDENAFILKVTGESMIDAGILDGDLLVVRQQSTANNGDIVVALLDDEATVKYFYREKRHVRLQPANAAFAPIVATQVEICGRVIGVIRSMK